MWEHLGYIDLEGLHKGIMNWPVWPGCYEITVLQWWVLVFNFPLTQKSEKEFKSGEKKHNLFPCNVETFICTKKNKEELFVFPKYDF